MTLRRVWGMQERDELTEGRVWVKVQRNGEMRYLVGIDYEEGTYGLMKTTKTKTHLEFLIQPLISHMTCGK